MQKDAIKPGQNVIVIDDLLATGMLILLCQWGSFLTEMLGGSAKAVGELVTKLGGKTLGYLFIIEVVFLKGASKLDAPVYSAIQLDEQSNNLDLE